MPVPWSKQKVEQNQEKVASSCCPFFLNILPGSPLYPAFSALISYAVYSSLSIPPPASSWYFHQASTVTIQQRNFKSMKTLLTVYLERNSDANQYTIFFFFKDPFKVTMTFCFWLIHKYFYCCEAS